MAKPIWRVKAELLVPQDGSENDLRFRVTVPVPDASPVIHYVHARDTVHKIASRFAQTYPEAIVAIQWVGIHF